MKEDSICKKCRNLMIVERFDTANGVLFNHCIYSGSIEKTKKCNKFKTKR